MIFLAPRGIGKQANAKLLANQVARQWFEELVSRPRAIICGSPTGWRLCELLWSEHEKGTAAMEAQLHDVMVESLTVDNVRSFRVRAWKTIRPIVGADGRQGATVAGMLRYVIGDENFFKT